MKIGKYFTQAEFEKSDYALRHGIDNTMNDVQLRCATLLVDNILDPTRQHFGPTLVTSMFRCPELNSGIGGSSSSQHMLGRAADFECLNASNRDVAEWISDILTFDQLILEYYDGTPHGGWIHASWWSELRNRNEVLHITDGKYIPGFPE